MNEQDFKQIGQLAAQVVDSRLEQVSAQFAKIHARLDDLETRFNSKFGTFKSSWVFIVQMGTGWLYSAVLGGNTIVAVGI